MKRVTSELGYRLFFWRVNYTVNEYIYLKWISRNWTFPAAKLNTAARLISAAKQHFATRLNTLRAHHRIQWSY